MAGDKEIEVNSSVFCGAKVKQTYLVTGGVRYRSSVVGIGGADGRIHKPVFIVPPDTLPDEGSCVYKCIGLPKSTMTEDAFIKVLDHIAEYVP